MTDQSTTRSAGSDSFITLDEAAQTVFGGHVTAWTLKAEIRRGNLQAFKLGRRLFTTPAAARELAQRLAVTPQTTTTRRAPEADQVAAARAALALKLAS